MFAQAEKRTIYLKFSIWIRQLLRGQVQNDKSIPSIYTNYSPSINVNDLILTGSEFQP
jgi:hypothetical protein